jgi:hypothetical protein
MQRRNDVSAKMVFQLCDWRTAMPRFYASAARWVILTLLLAGFGSDLVFAASPAGDVPEKTDPQGNDPPGSDNGEVTPPLVQDDGMILPPPTGDEGIHTQAPNPDAGHEEEVIPPPGTPGGDPSVEPR